MAEQPGIPCVIYAAKSTADPRGSIPGQLAELRELIVADARFELAGEYEDEAASAYHANRGPGLEAAMRHTERLAAATGHAELWAQHSDRLARGDGRQARHTVEIALWALKHDIQVRTIQDPETFRDLLYAVVTGQRNNEDSRRKGAASQAGIKRAAERGEHPGPPPDGYTVQKTLSEEGQLIRRIVIDPERRPVIALVFRLALRGRTCGQITHTLDQRGLLAKPGQPFGSYKPFTVDRVYEILTNPTYAALACHKGQVVASGDWRGYITPRQRERILDRMRRPPTAPGRPAGEPYLLSGLAWCGHCGQSLRARTNQPQRDGSRRRRYTCSSHMHHRGASQCSAPPVDAHTIEAMLIHHLPELLPDRPPPSPAAIKRRLRAAATKGDRRELDHAINAALHEPTRSQEDDQAIARLSRWAEQEAQARTPMTRAETAELALLLRRWFVAIAITVEPDAIVLHATSIHDTNTVVRVDRVAWAREHPACRFGLLYREWQRPELLGTLQAWAATHGRSPKPVDWRGSGPDHPSEEPVYRLYGTWNAALDAAGLDRIPEPRHLWSRREIIDALQAWAEKHGRSPRSLEWAKADATHPSNFTVTYRFGHRWDNALHAAGLPIPPDRRGHRPWSNKQIERAICDWTATHGRSPAPREWLAAGSEHPATATVVNRYGSWAAATEHAGFVA